MMVVGSLSRDCEVVVLGAGPGGYAVAIRLAQLGKDVVLVEKSTSLGGICLNEGCIPSKALIHAADMVSDSSDAAAMGIEIGSVSVDIPKLIAWKDAVVKRLTQGVSYLTDKNGVEVMHGNGKFTAENTMQVQTERGIQEVRFEHAVIATGSSPLSLNGFPYDGKRIIGSREALSPTSLPEHLVVIGGGYVGLELGEVYAKLGSNVSVVEFQESLVPNLDREIATLLLNRLKKLGINVFLGSKAESYSPGDKAQVSIVNRSGERTFLPADVVLVSVGRKPNTEGIGIESLGIELDERGFIRVNERMETTRPGIYAIGDVVGGPLLAHKAYREAKIVADIFEGESAAFDNIAIPAVVYTDPEIAWVGLQESEARQAGFTVVTGTFPLTASGRALTLNAPEGFVKTVADADTRRILGVAAVGKGVSEIVSKGGLALEMGALLDDIAASIIPHPTMSEALLESVEAALGKAIHMVNK